MLSQLPGKPLQYYDNTMDGFPPTSTNYDFIAHVLNAEDIKVSFDKIDGQDIISNNGHNFNKFTIYEISDGVNSVLTRVEIKNETTATLLSDISKVDTKNASLTIPKLGSPLNYEGVENGGHKCSFARFPKSGIFQKSGKSFVYTATEEAKYNHAYDTDNTSWFVLINDQFCCFLQKFRNSMTGFVVEVLRYHAICFDFNGAGVMQYRAVDNEAFRSISRHSITGGGLVSKASSTRKSSVLFPAVFDEQGADYVSNYLLSAASAPIINGTYDYIFSDKNNKFIAFYSYYRDNVFIVNVDGER